LVRRPRSDCSWSPIECCKGILFWLLFSARGAIFHYFRRLFSGFLGICVTIFGFLWTAGRGFSEINIMTNATYVPRLNKMTCARSTLDIDKIEFCMETSWVRPRKNRFGESEKYPRVSLPCIRSLCLTEIPGTRSAVSLGITLSHRKFCQNAHFQTSESRLDVHTHFWFFPFLSSEPRVIPGSRY